MSPLALTALIFGSMLALMAIRVPIAVSMFAAGALGYVTQTGWLPFANFLNTQAFARFASYDLSVIPLFILMGNFATKGGISKSLFEFAAAVMGRFKGGLAMASLLACAAFGAISGSSVATAATITSVALPEMRRHGYSGRIATGTLAAGGTLGIQLPPSIVLVIYAILTEQNISKLFAAAIVPGLIAMVGYMIAVAIYVRMVPGHSPEVEDAPPPMTWHAVLGVLPIVVIFVLVFGGIYGGLFTPTEGAAVGATTTFLTALGKGEMTFAKFKECFYGTAASAAMIFFIFLGADLMNSALALTQVPNQLAVGGRRLGPGAAGGGGGDPAVLRAARRGDGRAVDAAADDPDLLSDRDGAGLRHAQGVGGDLVRHHGADDGGLRADRAAGGPERLHRQRPGQGRADGRDLPRRDAVPGQRRDPHRCCSCSSRSFRCGWCASSADGSGHRENRDHGRPAGR